MDFELVQILTGRSTLGNPNAPQPVLITFDACLSQEPTYKNQVTRYPVEQGLDITDHIRQEPDMIKLEGIISNTPNDGTPNDDTGARVASAYQGLLNIAGRVMMTNTKQFFYKDPAPVLCDLIIKNRVMVNMICEEFSSPRDPSTGDAIHFTMTFVKIRMATVNLATVIYTSNAIAGNGTNDQLAAATDAGKQQVQIPKVDVVQSYTDWFNGKKTTSQFLGSLVGQ